MGFTSSFHFKIFVLLFFFLKIFDYTLKVIKFFLQRCYLPILVLLSLAEPHDEDMYGTTIKGLISYCTKKLHLKRPYRLRVFCMDGRTAIQLKWTNFY